MYCLYWSIMVSIKYQIGADGGNTWIFHHFGDIYALLELEDCSYSSSDRCFLRVTNLNCYRTPSGNPRTTAAMGFCNGWRAKWRCLLASARPRPWLSHSRRAPRSPSRGLCLFNETLFSTRASSPAFLPDTTVIGTVSSLCPRSLRGDLHESIQ